MDEDPWLDKWLPLLKQNSENGFILELGCGNGWDTLELLHAECNIIVSDLSTENLRATKSTVLHADSVQLDNSQPLTLASHSIDVILASLSLHYFIGIVTLQIASELKRASKQMAFFSPVSTPQIMSTMAQVLVWRSSRITIK
jgi:ubiquinone/menaquinone biosynthesis C-methylase UbiE